MSQRSQPSNDSAIPESPSPPRRGRVKIVTNAYDRQKLKNQRRTFLAASTRTDRSLDDRVLSAERASQINESLDGTRLRVSREDVENGRFYQPDLGEDSPERRANDQRSEELRRRSEELDAQLRAHDLRRRSQLTPAPQALNPMEAPIFSPSVPYGLADMNFVGNLGGTNGGSLGGACVGAYGVSNGASLGAGFGVGYGAGYRADYGVGHGVGYGVGYAGGYGGSNGGNLGVGYGSGFNGLPTQPTWDNMPPQTEPINPMVFTDGTIDPTLLNADDDPFWEPFAE